MTPKEEQDRFAEEAADTLAVFTFTRSGETLVIDVDGADVIPFWSTEARLSAVKEGRPDCAGFELTRMALSHFLAWLPELRDRKTNIGLNWEAGNLSGFDVEPMALRTVIEDRLKREGKLVVAPWDKTPDA